MSVWVYLCHHHHCVQHTDFTIERLARQQKTVL
jgi:hypothetical protein